ncbi:MAG: hypothetical protein ACI8YQ_003183 [Polaribacter sp.]|jgi:hypothetical protein
MSKNKRNITVLWLIALLLVPIILWILPGDFFDDGDLIICPSRFLFDIECFGCGMTRAVQHMHNFQWDDAVYYNTGVLFVYPGLIFTWCTWTYQAFMRIRSPLA